jgi:hypothetical protein
VVTILPARCYVANEWILAAALNQLHAMLPRIPEGVGTLGMIDVGDGIDEDYLVPFETRVGPGQAVQAMAHRPAAWVARHLRQHGAMVASGILTGYARVFAMHASRQWPGLARTLTKVMRVAANGEKRLHADGYREMPRSVLRWWPPTFPQRAFRVYRCGFRGLQTARAVASISASCPQSLPSTLSGDLDRVANRTSFQYLDSSAATRPGSLRRCVDHGWVD